MSRIALIILMIAGGVFAASFLNVEVEIGTNSAEARISTYQAHACASDNGCE